MADARALPAHRLHRLKAILDATPEAVVSLKQLAGELDVSEQTIRRDLALLEKDGIVDRTFGGAVIRQSQQRFEPTMESREIAQADKKLAIARRAIDFLSADDNVFFDASTTVLALIRLLPTDAGFAASSHSVSAVRSLSTLGIDALTLLGGEYRPVSDCVGGPQTIAQIDRMRFSVSFLSARAFDVRHGLTEARADEAALKSEVIRRSQRTIVLLDSSKLGTVSPYQFASLSEVDLLIIDSGVQEATADAIREAAPDLELIVVET